MNDRPIPWRRFMGEALVIVASVYVAIVLEGLSQDRGRREDARAALVQLLGELRQDREDLAEVRAEQEDLDSRYQDLLRWFGSPSALPSDSVQNTLDLVAYSNRTMFPSRSGWTTMVAAGQLPILDEPDLVTRLGNLYENVHNRLEYNGSGYDYALNEVMRVSTPEVWDPVGLRLFTDDPEALSRFRNELRYLHLVWNQWYLEYLGEYGRELDAVVVEVERYLERHGISAN